MPNPAHLAVFNCGAEVLSEYLTRQEDDFVLSLSEADLKGQTLRDYECPRIDLNHAQLDGCRFSGCKFLGGDFSGASMRKVTFSVCDFSGAKFTGADLAEADFCWSHFKEAIFRDADLSKAKISTRELEGALFTGAKTEGSSLCPTLWSKNLLLVLKEAKASQIKQVIRLLIAAKALEGYWNVQKEQKWVYRSPIDPALTKVGVAGGIFSTAWRLKAVDPQEALKVIYEPHKDIFNQMGFDKVPEVAIP